MLYLSRLFFDTQHQAVRHGLANCHRLHQDILRAFPDAPSGVQAREHFGVLYRVEMCESLPHLVRVLVQSSTAPEWSWLADTGYLGDGPDDGRGNPAVRRIDAEYERIESGMELVFRVRANPTRRIGKGNMEQGEKWRGKRVELTREEDQVAWLARKGESGGFRILGVQVRRDGSDVLDGSDVPDVCVAHQAKVRGRRPARAGGQAMSLRFGAVVFDGRLVVTDRAVFVQTLRQGIGSGKAFGFGLMSVAAR